MRDASARCRYGPFGRAKGPLDWSALAHIYRPPYLANHPGQDTALGCSMIKQIFAAALIVLPISAQAQSELRVKLPALPDDGGEIYCRPPMELQGRRLLGAKTCRPQQVWDDLHKQGLDLAPDGKTVVGSEK